MKSNYKVNNKGILIIYNICTLTHIDFPKEAWDTWKEDIDQILSFMHTFTRSKYVLFGIWCDTLFNASILLIYYMLQPFIRAIITIFILIELEINKK